MKSLLNNLETQTESISPGTYCNADVLIRNKQKILLVRDNLTSFTQTKLIQSEQKEDLQSGLLMLIYPLKTQLPTIIRVNPHPSFQALNGDKILKEHKISLEIGDEKNVTKNSVAEKGIQELEEELKKINSETINEIELMKATHGQIRHTHRSARELLMKRDQYTGENLMVDDKEVASKQKQRREKENEQKLKMSTKKDVEEYSKGDLVFVISDKNKQKTRDT